MQEEIEKQLKKNIVFLDTDLIVMKVWSDFKYGHCDPWIIHQIELNKNDLYLLTYPDLPWKPDPLREHPSASTRMKIFDRYVHELDSRKFPYKIIKGQQNDRINNAMVAILSHCPYLTSQS
jgi:nicotinamide riboside kinase